MRGGWSPYIVDPRGRGMNLDTLRCNNGHQFASLTSHQSSILITNNNPAITLLNYQYLPPHNSLAFVLGFNSFPLNYWINSNNRCHGCLQALNFASASGLSWIVLETMQVLSEVRTVLMGSQFEKAPIIVIFHELKLLVYVNFNDFQVVYIPLRFIKLYPSSSWEWD